MRTRRAADYTNTLGRLRLEVWHLGGRGRRARYSLRLTRRAGGGTSGTRYQNSFCDGDFRDLGQLVTALYWSLDDLVAGGELTPSKRVQSPRGRRRRQIRPRA